MTSAEILKPIQLTLFQLEPNWLDISLNWLLDYLQNNYPDANFQIIREKDWDGEYYESIHAMSSKRADVYFAINRDGVDLTIWDSPMIIHCDVQQNYGHQSGMGCAVDNCDDFKMQSQICINSWRNHIANYKNFRKRQKNEMDN